jgi:UDP-GlcNAc:undecaprenyl-phosphate GlcNAc-1-phosphate transferase
MKIQGMSLAVMMTTAISIIILLAFTVWQRIRQQP